MPTAALPKLRQVDDRLAQRCVHLVASAVVDKGAVELELGKRRLLEPRQRRISPAKMIDRQMNIEMAQLFRQLARQRKLGDDLLFRDVDGEARPFLELAAVALHDVFNLHLDQRFDRNIDRGPQRDAEVGEVDAGSQGPVERLLR